MAHPLTRELEHHGIAVIPDLLRADQLAAMQKAFAARLRRMRWNDVDGYEKTEPNRHMVQDLLTLDQGFLDLALHPVVKQVLREYLGDHFALVEAKGWLSLPTRTDFHGWHGDAWYDQGQVPAIPREVKLAAYLTDVRSGAFAYLRGSQGRQHPRPLSRAEAARLPAEQVVEITGPAGTCILFDTTGLHRQAHPILEPRRALFYCYHDPHIPLQREDVEYNRYHPLLLNAAFLGGLSGEDQRILGFGDGTHHIPCFERQTPHRCFQRCMQRSYDLLLSVKTFCRRQGGRLGRLLRRG